MWKKRLVRKLVCGLTHVQNILHYTPKALVFPGQICIEDGELEGMQVVSDT